MRTANFRDDVLWAIAYKLGLDPEVDFLKDQATAIASYINAWVRRTWEAADWPEWTSIRQFTLPPGGHTILFDQLPSDTLPDPKLIGKALRAYLVDPRTTWGPVDTPFRISDLGYFVGFEHGPQVWLKYLVRAPKFTAKEWDTDTIYKKDALVYSPDSGECYTSKANNNWGHNPGGLAESDDPVALTAEITQQFAPANPGLDETPQVTNIIAAAAPGMGDVLPPALTDPPPAGQTFLMEVTDAVGTVLGDATTAADGVMTLEDVFNDLATQLSAAPGLSTFTITVPTAPLGIRLENASVFTATKAFYLTDVASLPLAVQQAQPYTPEVPAALATPKQIKLSMSTEQVIPGATYQLTFTSLDGAVHPVVYRSLGTDDDTQILAGLINAMIALQGADPFFANIQSTLDTLSPSATFTIDPTIAKVSMDAMAQPPGSIWWTYIPFPLALVDEVVRGAYADCLREGGQPDKAAPEEAKVATEASVSMDSFASKQFDGLTDQQVVRSRYGKS